ncbi:MAG: exosortase/archaeosortase family protein [Bacteroidetes bacterium]|nr:exosortase/archaeosortase family protein [Bacteroidota bacterium]MBL6962251.1 exosortase/archaeosortase family protein [Bacteroidota bacterium]
MESFKDISYFVLIVLIMHVVWRIWKHQFGFHILGIDVLGPAHEWLTEQVRNQSAWFLNHILQIHTEVEGETFIFSEYSRMGVTRACSGLKQFYQFLGIIIFFYGSWKKKLWFIPLGLLTIHLINLFRIIFLSVIVIYKLEWFNFMHDWIVRPLFYVAMFLFWVWWIDIIAKRPAEYYEHQDA